MKRLTLSLVVLVATATSPLVVVNARAAESEAAAAAESAGHPRLQEIARELELTDEQKAKIEPILAQEMTDLRALRDNTSLRRMQKLRKAREIDERASKQVRAQLTPEQQKKYDVMRAERQKQMRERARERAGERP